jgi:hypothetical protein
MPSTIVYTSSNEVLALYACCIILLLLQSQAFLLHDRLMNCSDRHVAYVCSVCGSILSPCHKRNAIKSAGQTEAAAAQASKYVCQINLFNSLKLSVTACVRHVSFAAMVTTVHMCRTAVALTLCYELLLSPQRQLFFVKLLFTLTACAFI